MKIVKKKQKQEEKFMIYDLWNKSCKILIEKLLKIKWNFWICIWMIFGNVLVKFLFSFPPMFIPVGLFFSLQNCSKLENFECWAFGNGFAFFLLKLTQNHHHNTWDIFLQNQQNLINSNGKINQQNKKFVHFVLLTGKRTFCNFLI